MKEKKEETLLPQVSVIESMIKDDDLDGEYDCDMCKFSIKRFARFLSCLLRTKITRGICLNSRNYFT